tara:strand:+ start:157 stop:468 length:312 start_codon:yes stop_codon:yes gene_type:complete
MEILCQEAGKGFIGLSWNEGLNDWELHVEATPEKFTPSILKQYYKNINKVKTILKKRGIKYVYGICETKKERKFNFLFGAKPVPNGIVLTEDGLLNYLTIMEI